MSDRTPIVDAMKAEAENIQQNMRPPQAARYTATSESTLAKLRMRENRAKGPRFAKLSGCVIYRKSDLDEWIERNVVQATD